VSTIVAGLETVGGPEALARILDRTGPDRLVFSLDLRAGVPLIAAGAGWGGIDPVAIAATAIARGVRRLLLLDLARVGRGEGTGTHALLARLAAAHSDVEIAVGGGVSDVAGLAALECAGASAGALREAVAPPLGLGRLA